MSGFKLGQSELAQEHGIDPFELYCCYHLGIQEDGSYRFGNVHDVARRFQVGPGIIKQSLADFHLRSEDFWNLDFDLVEAQVQVGVAEAGANLRELAKASWQLLMNAKPAKRDWEAELRRDAAVNAKTNWKD